MFLSKMIHRSRGKRAVPALCNAGHLPRGVRSLVIAVLVVLFGAQLSSYGQMDQAKPGEVAAPAIGGKAPTTPGDPHAGLNMPANGGTAASPQSSGFADLFHKQNREEFEKKINLDAFRLLAVQHSDQIKLLDSWARQSIGRIRNRQTIDGKDPLYVALDITFRPDAWGDKNIIYVQSVPIRQELARLAPGATEAERQVEAKRIVEKATVSPDFLRQRNVLALLQELQQDSRKSSQVSKVFMGLAPFGIGNMDEYLLAHDLNIIPPAPANRGQSWVNPIDLDPEVSQTGDGPTGYTTEQKLKINLALRQLANGWVQNDVDTANAGIAGFVSLVTTIDPPAYPSLNKRTVELWYNRSFNGTLVAFVYFFAMVLFLLVAVGVSPKAGKVETAGLVIFGIAVAVHIVAMAVRWWLAGRIPIQSQFESILGSACSGCFIGLILEATKRNGIFGTAFSFVGFLAATSLLAAPYVFGQDLGAGIGKVAGILDDYWLYIHVNIVIASYALISASFCVGLIYLLVRQWHWVNPIEPGSDDTGGGNAPAGKAPRAGQGAPTAAPALTLQQSQIVAQRTQFLDTLDQANMVILQMAFWFLGIGVICGAVWADHSWGRPWGWDPKETFALVTWMVYLVIVHLRLVVRQKADATAWMSIVGFGVMMFNWVGVNFWLAGLHSYA